MRTFGIERERFIIDANGNIVSAIETLLPRVQALGRKHGFWDSRFTHELFAGQIEDRTPPTESLYDLRTALVENDSIMHRAVAELGLPFDYSEAVNPCRITSLDVNPFDERHRHIWGSITLEQRIAASVCASVHVHIAVPANKAVATLNRCREDVIERLIDVGDHSNRKRIDAYRAMAKTDGVPPEFSSFLDLMAYIYKSGGEKNVWDLVRYKPSTGTVEFRMFGTTSDVDEILGYVHTCCGVIG